MEELRKVVEAVNTQRFGFAAEANLSRSLLAPIAGLVMGYRSGNEMADVIGADRLWREVLGGRVTQIDLSRLVGLLADRGLDILCRGIPGSAAEGGRALRLDGDFSMRGRRGSGSIPNTFGQPGLWIWPRPETGRPRYRKFWTAAWKRRKSGLG